ncbi:MAG TPA: nicotinate-nucleotide adenylyltransferase [Pseudohongiella sp.]|nr:nicotinate-nucleotide adenylyltransferase [Pseudohongiella sp.]
MNQQRLGVMGGMFDPVHDGHLAAARLALDELALERVHLVPCSQPNHRSAPGVSGEHRVAMLELAIAGDSRLTVDTRELQRPGVSYMVDTLRSFVAEYPQALLVYILGQDSFYSLPRWHQWRELLDLCHLAVIHRPEQTPADSNVGLMPSELESEFRHRHVASVDALMSSPRGKILRLDDLDIPASSTSIRQKLAQGSRAVPVPSAVLDYIKSHGLYRPV